MQRQDKERVVSSLTEKLQGSSLLVLSEFKGINVHEMNRLRRQVQKSKGEFRVVKNTLMRRALDNSGIYGLEGLLNGPTAVFYTDQEDPSILSKTILSFLKEKPELIVKGLALDKRPLASGVLKDLSELPSKEQLLARFVGILNHIPARFVQTLQGLPQKLLLTLQALEKVKA